MTARHDELAAPGRSQKSGTATGVGLLALHLGALAAFIPHTFTWPALVVAATLYCLTGALGISLGYHRILTHRSLRCPRWLEYAFATLGALSLQGGPITWVATHRAHHANTDREGDPHNAYRGLRWSHVEWLYRRNEARPTEAEQHRLAPDLMSVPFYVFLERTSVLWQVVLAIILFALGGWPLVIWGIFVRVVVSYHVTWLVNSAAHHSGYQTFRTGDKSTNNWWVALLAWGEGWHNNHHAFPFSARHGLRWFEFDLTWLTIRLLRALRLARDVKLPTPAMIARVAFPPKGARGQSS
jgi:fatty-acid desaturase